MANKDPDTKIIPSLHTQKFDFRFCPKFRRLIFSSFFFGCFLLLLVAVSFLPLSFSLRVIALIAGSFLIEDLHRSIKGRISSV